MGVLIKVIIWILTTKVMKILAKVYDSDQMYLTQPWVNERSPVCWN